MKKTRPANSEKEPSPKEILGIKISSGDESKLLKQVLQYFTNGKKFFIVTPNPEIIVAATKDTNLTRIINSADISIADGFGIVVASAILNLTKLKRIPGRIFFLHLLNELNEKRGKAFLLGSNNEVISSALIKAKKEFPNLLIDGHPGPLLDLEATPINSNEASIESAVITKINKFSPDILFIAFGSPKQEKWWGIHKDALNTHGAMVVGGSLDYYSGYKKLPPKLMANLGLEWLWRLFTEKKHSIRVFNAVIVFPIHILLKKVNSVLYK